MRTATVGGPNHPVPSRVYADPVALGEGLGALILEDLAPAAQEGRPYLLGCPGGRSPMSTYQAMGRFAAAASVDLSPLVIVMMDEYVFPAGAGFVNCPADAHYSCHRAADEEIAGVLNAGLDSARQVRPENVWFPDPARPATYDEQIRAAGGIDLFIIATGAGDGHVAFNPPGTPADSPTRIIRIADTTRTDNLRTFPDFAGLEDVPAYGVGVGLGTISGLSRRVVLIAHGEDKQYAVRRLAQCDGFGPQWPASLLYLCRSPQVMLDEAAAGGLPVSPPSPPQPSPRLDV